MTRVLLTGATGFVGARLLPGLVAAGLHVRAGSRRPGPAASMPPGVEPARCDLDDPASVRAALEGCEAAYYLVHAMATGHGYGDRELAQARTFASAAADARVARIVYLGGPVPAEGASEHLRSRQAVGEALRGSPVPTLELRASMIVGHGSTSWKIVRDLSTRLPFMILPRWTSSRTQPVAIEDVLAALTRAASMPLPVSRIAGLPGPETLTVRQILERVARVLGRRPTMIPVPVLTPELSALWLRFVSGAPRTVAEELVLGLGQDLVMPASSSYWAEAGLERLTPFDEAVRRALAAEAAQESPRWVRSVERIAGWLSARPRGA